MSTLVTLAEQILHHATILQKQLDEASAPSPTLEAGGPSQYPPPEEHPDIYRTRATLIDASNDLLALALGPYEHLRTWVGPDQMNFAVLRVIERFQISTLVPHPGSISFASLAAKLEVNPNLLERLLRHAFTMRLFRQAPDNPDHVAHTPLSLAVPTVASWIWLQHCEETSSARVKFPDALAVWSDPARPGVVQNPLNLGTGLAGTFWDILDTSPDGRGGTKRFADAMRVNNLVMPGSIYTFVDRAFDWEAISAGEGPVVDVGGGNGHVTIALARTHRHLHVVIQDLPGNQANAEALITPDLQDRVRFQAQDFFTPQPDQLPAFGRHPPPAAAARPGAYFLKSILHDWPDAECERILAHLLPSLLVGVRLFVVDRVLPDHSSSSSSSSSSAAKTEGQENIHLDLLSRHTESMLRFMDLEMFALLDGKERTLRDWRSLFARVHPRLTIRSCRVPVGCEYGMMEVGIGEVES